MADILIDKNGKSLDTSDRLDGYSRVIIRTGQTDETGNDIVYVSGNETGRTLEIDNPWGNQAVADNVLAKIQGWAYQPMDAGSVKLPPAYELGDSVVVNNVFSGIYNANVRFSSVFAGDIKAPIDKEIDHEYQFEDSKERKYSRKLNDAVARLNFFADSIEAKVDKVNENATFGWRLTDDGWSVFNQNGNLFSVDANGASVTGEIKANSGSIGGFTIGRDGISTNSQTYGGGETNGIYIGANGIQLGTKFRVDSQGNLYAANGTFDGNIYAKNIRYGGDYGTLSGGAISPWSLDTGQFAQNVRDSLGFANFANKVFNNQVRADYVTAKNVTGWTYWVGDELADGLIGTVNQHTHFIKDLGNGEYAIGAPDFGGGTHSFKVAPSVGNVTISLNGGATYQNSMDRFAVPVKATDQNGNVVGTGTVYVRASVSIGYDETYYEPGWRTYYHFWAKLNGNEDWGASFNAYANTSAELVRS